MSRKRAWRAAASAASLTVLVLLVVAVARFVSVLRQVPPHKDDPTKPLTDMAPRVPLRPWDNPAPPTPTPMPQPSAVSALPPQPYLVPSGMADPMHLPQGTKPMAIPGPPRPPNPWVSPPMDVNSERGHHTNTEPTQ